MRMTRSRERVLGKRIVHHFVPNRDPRGADGADGTPTKSYDRPQSCASLKGKRCVRLWTDGDDGVLTMMWMIGVFCCFVRCSSKGNRSRQPNPILIPARQPSCPTGPVHVSCESAESSTDQQASGVESRVSRQMCVVAALPYMNRGDIRLDGLEKITAESFSNAKFGCSYSMIAMNETHEAASEQLVCADCDHSEVMLIFLFFLLLSYQLALTPSPAPFTCSAATGLVFFSL